MAILMGVVALILAGCETTVSDRDLRFIDTGEALELSQGKSGVLGLGEKKAVWVDPRPVAEYRQEHIPGAVNIALNDVQEKDPRLTGASVFIVYGQDYESPLANAMAKRLLALGYNDVRTLRGGLRAWKQAGHPTAGAE